MRGLSHQQNLSPISVVLVCIYNSIIYHSPIVNMSRKICKHVNERCMNPNIPGPISRLASKEKGVRYISTFTGEALINQRLLF